MINPEKHEPYIGHSVVSSYKPKQNDSIDLDLEHPDFIFMKQFYERCFIYTHGGALVEGKKEFLKKHVYETEKQYAIRLWLAKYRNHVAPIVELFHSAIWDIEPDRDKLDSTLKSYFDNVDCNNINVNDFFKQVSRQAAMTGVSFVLVDYKKSPTIAKTTTKKEADKYNLRPYFKLIQANELIDWSFNKDTDTGIESLEYIVFKKEVSVAAIPFKQHIFQTQYNLWTKDKWEIWVYNEDKSKAQMIESGTHSCGIVPIVSCYFEEYKSMVGKSAVFDIVGLCERIYRNSSCLDKSLYDTAFPLQLFLGFNATDIETFQRASSTGLISQDTNASSKYVEPEGRSFAELRTAISSDEQAIKEIALRMIRPDSKVAESAEARKLDRKQLDSKLARFAANVESCEQECWRIFGLWLGINTEVDVEYCKSFNDDILSVEVIKLFSELADKNVIPHDEIINAFIRSGFLPDTYDKIEAQEKIKQQARTNIAYETAQSKVNFGIDNN